jgi:hypothetical protein
MTAQFNPEVRALYEDIIKRNVVPRDNYDYMPQRYGGGRVREEALCGNDGHYPSIQQIENSNFGGAYGRSEYPIQVGGSRKCGGVGVLKQARAEPFINEINEDYMPVSSAHGAGRAPRLTKAIKQQILDMHPELKAHMLRGGKVDFKKLWGQIKSGLNVVSKAAPIISSIAPEEYKDTINKTGNISGAISGMGRRKKAGSMAQMAAIDLARRAMSKRKGGNFKSFMKDFGTGFEKGFKETAKIAAPALGVASIFQPELAPLAAATGLASKAMGNGRKRMTLPKSGHKRLENRGLVVGDVMRKYGMSLGEASRYVKEHGLY